MDEVFEIYDHCEHCEHEPDYRHFVPCVYGCNDDDQRGSDGA